MAPEPHLHLHLDVALDGGTLVGRVGRDGGASRPFTGWIALNAAVERLLEDGPRPVGRPEQDAAA